MEEIHRARELLTFRLGQADLLWELSIAEFSQSANNWPRLAAIAVILRMWSQYKIDRAEEIHGSLISDQDIRQRNRFMGLLAALFDENPLMVRAISDIRRIIGSDNMKLDAFNADTEHEIDALCSMSAEIKRMASSIDAPDKRIANVIKRFAMLDIVDDQTSFIGRSNCWMINLALSSASKELGLTSSPLPYPALIRRELLRIDDDIAMTSSEIARLARKSVEVAIIDLLSLSACRVAWIRTVANLQKNNRSLEVYRSLLTFGEMTPLGMSRLLSDRDSHDSSSLSEPGARKLLVQLQKHGFAAKLNGTARFRAIRKFSVNLPALEWLSDTEFPHVPQE